MLKPAQRFADELRSEILDSWYRPENIFWSGGPFDRMPELPENNYDAHHFVSVDRDYCIIGYICYNIDWAAMSVDSLEAISFDKGNPTFAYDLYRATCDVFEVYGMNRLMWYCHADNPAIRSYRYFIKKHGGRECAHLRQAARLQDGKLHDSVAFEILAEEFDARGHRPIREVWYDSTIIPAFSI